MARNWFGGDLTAWVFRRDDAVRPNLVQLYPGAVVEFFSAASGGTAYTDLRLNGQPVASVIASDGTDGFERGSLPQFQGPDTSTVFTMWAQVQGTSVRSQLVATNIGDVLSDVRTQLGSVSTQAGGYSVWNGSAYVPAPSITVPYTYVGPTDPATIVAIADGSMWIPTEREQLTGGVRASAANVGFRGDPATLIVLNPGNSLVGTPFATAGSWIGNALVVNGDNIVVDGYRINGALFFSGGVSPIVRNSIITAPAGEDTALGTSNNASTLLVEDCTISGSDYTVVNCSQRLIARRLDVSGGENGFAVRSWPGSTLADGSFITQCRIHSMAFTDLGQHCDGVEVHQHATLATFLTIEHCLIEPSFGPGGVAISSAISIGQGPSDTSGLVTNKIDNNALLAGAYHLRLEYRTQNNIVTNNNFGTVDTAAGEFGLVAVSQPLTIATWTGNVNGAGATVAQPT